MNEQSEQAQSEIPVVTGTSNVHLDYMSPSYSRHVSPDEGKEQP